MRKKKAKPRRDDARVRRLGLALGVGGPEVDSAPKRGDARG